MNSASLVLQTGSRAGLQAPLQLGYYMIGRHNECQIRPKSRSVSRHHCLIYNAGNMIQVIDLDSTSGTKINEERIEARSWIEVHDGDLVRCGKIVFQLSFENPDRATNDAGVVENSSMVQGEAWHEVDIADYLGAEDEIERERRYGKIREQNSKDQDSTEFDVFEDDVESSMASTVRDFEEIGEEVTVGKSASSPPALKDQDGGDETDHGSRDGMPRSEMPRSERSRARNPSVRAKPPKSERRTVGRLPREKRRKSDKGAGLFSDVERTKMYGAAVLTFLTIGVLSYSVYAFSFGPSVRVLEEID